MHTYFTGGRDIDQMSTMEVRACLIEVVSRLDNLVNSAVEKRMEEVRLQARLEAMQAQIDKIERHTTFPLASTRGHARSCVGNGHGQVALGNISNINTTNNTNTIVVNTFGKEKMDHISHYDKIEWARNPAQGVVDYVRKKHFDPDMPCNHNFRIKSTKKNTVEVYRDGWCVEDAKPVLKKLVSTAVADLYPAIDWPNLKNDDEKLFEEIQNAEDISKTQYGRQGMRNVWLMAARERENDSKVLFATEILGHPIRGTHFPSWVGGMGSFTPESGPFPGSTYAARGLPQVM
jgi:hypothetical protein